MAKQRQGWKPGKGVALVRGRLGRLRQEDETWEADFRALPKPLGQGETCYLSMVVTKRSGSVLAETQVEGRPSANDLATLLGQAMRQPLADAAHRPRRVHLRGHHQWRELFPHLQALGMSYPFGGSCRESRKLTKIICANSEKHSESAWSGPPLNSKA